MHSLKDLLSGVKFEKQNGQEIDFDKVRTVTIVKEDIRDGDRLVVTAQYDNGTRFELNGAYRQTKAQVEPKKAEPAKAEPVKVVGEAQLKPGEAVVSTASPTASAPGAIQRTSPDAQPIPASAVTAQTAAPMTGPVKGEK